MPSRPQAISGVSTGEGHIMTVYPSISAGAAGRLLGRLYESVPVKIFGIKVSYILFCLPTAPLALMLYVLTKLSGSKYVLTTDSVEIWSVLGKVLHDKTGLTDFTDIVPVQYPGQVFYHASDLEFRNAAGDTLLTLPGVPHAEVFAETITKAQLARLTVAESLDRIKARQTA